VILKYIKTGFFICILLIPFSLFAQDLSKPTTEDIDTEENSDRRVAEASEADAAQEEARAREVTAEEDPLAQQQAESVEKPEEKAAEPNRINLYGSVRFRYRNQEGEEILGDGDSRIGIEGKWQFLHEKWLFGRVEAGINLLDELDFLLNPKGRPPERSFGDAMFPRLAYVGIDLPSTIAVFGKNWSTYYQVASFTDRFEATGGSASGTYNAGTDGGETGTGRADLTLQTRFLIDFLPQKWMKPFNVNVQIQHGQPIPWINDVHYGTAFGLSTILQTKNDFTLGVAYNWAQVKDKDNPAVQAAGIDGNAQALLIGSRWFGDNWYVGVTVSRLHNLDATDEKIYFDGWGWELYAQRRLLKRLWVVGGWNQLEPDSDQVHAGAYNVNYGVIGLRYTFKEFTRMIYVTAQFENSHNADGTRVGNIFTVGLRWDMPDIWGWEKDRKKF
jgi:predicted porin